MSTDLTITESPDLGFVVDTLDDTLYAVVRLTREHDLPVCGVSVRPRDVLVYCDRRDMAVWVRWLTVAEDRRLVAWRNSDGVHLHIAGRRAGIGWATCETLKLNEFAVAGVDVDQVRDVNSTPVTSEHVPVDPDLMCRLLEIPTARDAS